MAVKLSLGSGCPPWGLCTLLSSNSIPNPHVRVKNGQIFRRQSFVIDYGMHGGMKCPREHTIGIKLIF